MARGTWAAVLMVLVIACGTTDQQTVRPDTAFQSPSAAAATLPAKCCVPPPEPRLKIAVHPSSGSPGTVAHLLITGCGDAARTNEATVSFNNDALDPSARNDPDTVRNLGVHHGTRITLSYRIQGGDRTGGLGQFFVQCGQTVLDTPFKVSG
jgi:hypothetical protein